MKKIFKLFLIIIIILLILLGGGLFYLSRGLDTGISLTINELDLSLFDDGIYRGEYDSGRFSNKVLIEIEGDRIKNVSIEKDLLFSRPEVTEELINKILIEQSNKVDVITGATVSCNAYLKAIENALTSY